MLAGRAAAPLLQQHRQQAVQQQLVLQRAAAGAGTSLAHFSSKLTRVDSFVGVSSSTVGGKRSAEDAVNNLLYNAPAKREKETRHVMSIFVDNEPGVLSKVSGLLSARGFNIRSLSVSSTDVKELSRMTVVLDGADAQVTQAERQLEDLPDCWMVVSHRGRTLERELGIIKVSCAPPKEGPAGQPQPPLDIDAPRSYDTLMENHFHRQAVLQLAGMFEAKVTDVGSESVILEIVSWPKRVDAFFRILEPYGIIEGARSGVIAMNRAAVAGEDDGQDAVKSVVDLANLPPS